MFTKTEAKEKARDIVADAIGVIYYRVADSNDYTEDEKELLIHYINQVGVTACKAIKKPYTTD